MEKVEDFQGMESLGLPPLKDRIADFARKAGHTIISTIEVKDDDNYAFDMEFDTGYTMYLEVDDDGEVYWWSDKRAPFLFGNIKTPARIIDNFRKIDNESGGSLVLA